MNRLPKTLEKITNIAVIVAFVLFLGGFLLRTYKNYQSQGPRAGETLPELTGYDWKSRPQSLILVLQKQCRFCEESMPFYRTLYSLQKDARLSATMVAVFPDNASEVNELLTKESLPIPAIPGISAASLKASGTPTLILVDRNRRVIRTWVGELDSAGRNSVLETLSTQAHGAMDGKCTHTDQGRKEDMEACDVKQAVLFSAASAVQQK